jgi:hypothetical protein
VVDHPVPIEDQPGFRSHRRKAGPNQT